MAKQIRRIVMTDPSNCFSGGRGTFELPLLPDTYKGVGGGYLCCVVTKLGNLSIFSLE